MAATQSFLMTAFIRPKNLQHIYIDSWKISEHSRCRCYENIYKLLPACFFLCSVCLLYNLVTDPKPCQGKWHQNSLSPFASQKVSLEVTWSCSLTLETSMPALRRECLPSRTSLGNHLPKNHRSIFQSVKQYLIYTLHFTQFFSI